MSLHQMTLESSIVRFGPRGWPEWLSACWNGPGGPRFAADGSGVELGDARMPWGCWLGRTTDGRIVMLAVPSWDDLGSS